jgi:hypothetical protein
MNKILIDILECYHELISKKINTIDPHEFRLLTNAKTLIEIAKKGVDLTEDQIEKLKTDDFQKNKSRFMN